MKYNTNNTPLVCMMTNSTCYKATYPMEIKGILWHSTGANNPKISRYVQPNDDALNKEQILSIIGVNKYKNDWNHIEYKAGVNAFIGQLADGSVATVQTMPWNYRPWGCGQGKYGSCNNGWIQFEIAEDNLQNKDYFDKIYKEACELTAYLCKMFSINPLGRVIFNGLSIPTILCHADSYTLGLGSNHGDILHWFKIYGKTMDNVRQDVFNLLQEKDEDDEMTQERFNEMMNTWLKEQSAKDTNANWSAAARNWAESNGYVQGDEKGNKMYKKFLTREEFVTVLYRILKQ